MEYLSPWQLLVLAARSLKYATRTLPAIRIVREEPSAEPLVSVIIATYNWSSVLRLAIHSVLWQTEQDFEILVVGDGCTDDSEAVAQSFGDARVRWHNLPRNYGHQTAPNNAGLRLARGRYIAYLGHDDIWHPEHLRTLVVAIDRSKADFASSLVEMIGPPGSNYRDVAGIHPKDGYDGRQALPVSGLVHRREVVSRIGEWKDYREVWRNPDVDFVYRGVEAGLKFVSTEEMTVFKFNSAMRKNCYQEKPFQEQLDCVRRIENRRTVMFEEMVDIAGVHLRRLPVKNELVVPPPPDPHTPGWRLPFYRKFRGLD
ncbi:MAG: glycosyltransferase [Acidobacteriia bacterium]|nr:glycosyltransferase [Terriglobia bacterium]